MLMCSFLRLKNELRTIPAAIPNWWHESSLNIHSFASGIIWLLPRLRHLGVPSVVNTRWLRLNLRRGPTNETRLKCLNRREMNILGSPKRKVNSFRPFLTWKYFFGRANFEALGQLGLGLAPNSAASKANVFFNPCWSKVNCDSKLEQAHHHGSILVTVTFKYN